MALRRGLDQTLVRHLIVALVAGVALYLLTEALSPTTTCSSRRWPTTSSPSPG